MTLKIYLFGSPRFTQGDHQLKLIRRKSIALIAFLAVTRQPHPRDTLAGLCWPEFDQSSARTNLRRDLSWLRRQLPPQVLLVDRMEVEFNPEADVWVDVYRFEAGLAATQAHNHPHDSLCSHCAPVMMEAVDLYQGDFMAGFSLSDCIEFEEWLFFQQEQQRQAMIAALERLVTWFSDQESYEQGIEYTRRWLNLDPLHEPAHCALMQLYAKSGHQAAALRQYEACTRLLEEEFGLAPELETTTLYEAIKADRLIISAAKVRSRAEAKERASERVKTDAAAPPEVPPLPRFLLEETDPIPAPVFVARERELADLEAAMDSARAGQGQILFVIGGAGRGKTALTQEFARRVQDADADLAVISGYCDAMTGFGDPYLPFRGALAMLTGDVEAKWAGGLISQTHAKRLWELMPMTLPALVHHAPDLIGNLLPPAALQTRAATIATPEIPWFNQLNTLAKAEDNSGLEQQRIFTQYAAMLKAIAAQRPILFVIEDLHWVDTASSGLLFHLSRQIENSRILLVGTYRPEEVPLSWSDDRHPLAGIVSELKRQHGDIWLDLDDMATIEGRQFVEAYLDTQPNKLDAAFREALFRHTGGYALFTAELLRDMQERGDLAQDNSGHWTVAGSIDWETLPPKVEGVIEKRVKRLEKKWQKVLTIASVEGEIFTAEVVARVQDLAELDLVHQLSGELDKRHRLIMAQTLERLGQQRLSRYRFRHHLFQHYLYHNLDEMERGYLHEAIGNVLEDLFANRTEEIAVQLAWHFQEAGLVTKAIHYLQQAGDVAGLVYAHTEAIASYRQALSLISEHDVNDYDLTQIYSRLGRTLELDSQFDEALTTYEEMGSVAHQHNNRPMELAALMAQVTLYATPTSLHDPIKGLHQGQEALSLARELGDQTAEVKTLWNLALGGMWSGRTLEGIDYGEQAVLLARQRNLKELLAYALNDLGMLRLSVLHLEQGRLALAEAASLFRELDNLPMLTNSMSMASGAHILAGEFDQAIALSDEAFQNSEASNNLWGQSFSKMFVCWAYWELGQPDRAITMANESVRLGKSAGFVAAQVLAGGHRAAIFGNLGALEQALDMADQAIKAAEAEFPHFLCHPLGIMAQLQLQAGNMVEAKAMVAQGKKDPNSEAHPAWNMRIYIAEAELLLKQGEYEQAVVISDHWLARLRRNKLRTYMPNLLHIKSQALLAMGQVEAAREDLIEARDVAEAIGSRAMIWPNLVALSQLEDDPTQAENLRQEAREIIETIASHTSDPFLCAAFLDRPQIRTLFP